MATTVYNKLDVELLDGSVILLRPLPIKALREFMKKIDELSETGGDQDAFMDKCLEAAIICIRKEKPEFNGEDGFDLAGDVLDMDTIYKILEVCGGVKLNDPKLIEMAQQEIAKNAAAGTN